MSAISDNEKRRFVRLIEAAMEGDFCVLSPLAYGLYKSGWHDDEYSEVDFTALLPTTQKFSAVFRAQTGMQYHEARFIEPCDAIHVFNMVALIQGTPMQSATGNKWWAHQNGYNSEIIRRVQNAGFRLDGSFGGWTLPSTDLEKVVAASVGTGELMGKIPKFLDEGDYKEAINECHDVIRTLVGRYKLEPNKAGFSQFAERIAGAAKKASTSSSILLTPAHIEAFTAVIRDARIEVNKTIAAEAFVDDEHAKHMAVTCVALTSYIVGMHIAESKLVEEMLS